MSDQKNKERRTIISPEGVEERVEHERGHMITMTQGGKFRIYAISDDVTKVIGSPFDDRKTAEKELANIEMLNAALRVDPERTVNAMMKSMRKGRK